MITRNKSAKRFANWEPKGAPPPKRARMMEEEEEPHMNIPLSAFDKILDMQFDRDALHLADAHGLVIDSISWEDCARAKGSVYGPNISDMTLSVKGRNMPIIRYPNFQDLTWDVPMSDIPLFVGNQTGLPLAQVNLKEYLSSFRSFLHDPSDWPGGNDSLYVEERDSHVLMSAQACLLPVNQGEETAFQVCLSNYQSSATQPAVLAVVATANGTSARIINQPFSPLQFNQNGRKADFVAQRLSDHRAERGLIGEESNGPSTNEEQSLNVVSVIQVPLKHRPIVKRSGMKKKSRSRERSRGCDVEEAVIKVGKAQGPFKEIEGIAIERDPNYPVRVTLQFYKCTSTAVLNDEVLKTISRQLETARTNADAVGSLVLPFATKRPTEWQHQAKSATEGTDKEHDAEFLDVPAWWDNWWLVNGIQFPELEERDAKRLLFKEEKHSAQTLSEAHHQILRELSSHTTRAGPEFKKDTKYVKWGKTTLG